MGRGCLFEFDKFWLNKSIFMILNEMKPYQMTKAMVPPKMFTKIDILMVGKLFIFTEGLL